MVHILLAEDNQGDIWLVQQSLVEHRVAYELHIVRDGGEALDFIAHMGEAGGPPCPDVVLLDLNLPKATGAEVLAEFRKHPACMHTPVVAVTSSDAPKDRARMAELGVVRYFKKPSDLAAFLQLGNIVREIVEHRG
jgi:CheY-like chemotaxis protein